MLSRHRVTVFIPAIAAHTLRTTTFTRSMLSTASRRLSSTMRGTASPTAVLRQPPRPTTTFPSSPKDDKGVFFLDESEHVYRLPPQEIVRLVDGSSDPSVSLQPACKKWVIMLQRPNLPPIAEVAAEELRLAGFRVNANTYAPSRSEYYIGMTVQRVDDPSMAQLPIAGLPPPPGKNAFLELGYVRWAPDGSKFAFCIYDPSVGLELWTVDIETRRAKCALPGVRLNAVCGDPFTWSADSNTIIAKLVCEDHRVPQKSAVPRGPLVQENLSSKPAPSRTFQDLLKSRHDIALFEHYTTCQLGLVDTGACDVRFIGEPAAFRRASPSPDGRYLLIDAMVPPFMYMMPASRFPRKVEVWDAQTGQLSCVVAKIPLQDKIPIAFDGVGEGPRNIGWRADNDATLCWAEAQDGGDPNVEAEIRDCVFTMRAPFTTAPRKLASLPWRYSGIIWGSDSVALLSERRYKTRSARSYLIAPGPSDSEDVPGEDSADIASAEVSLAMGPCCARACDLNQGEAPRRLIIDVPNWEDRYNDPGSVCTTRNEAGKIALRLIFPHGRMETEDGVVGRPFLMMQGAGASEDGDRPFLSLFDTVDGSKTLLWQSSPPKFESVGAVLKENMETGAPEEVLIRQESTKENPNFFILDVQEGVAMAFASIAHRNENHEPTVSDASFTSAGLRAVTKFPHPAPDLIDVQREIVHYERADGVRLNASLYLPPGYDPKKDGTLPVFVWAYPREYKSAKFAGQTRGSPYRFARLARTPLYWLTRGYAILDGPEMPIIGEGETEANDTYIKQLVMSAEAAVDFLVKRKIGDVGRIAIGGHSYGAFMAVNLLAHASDLFCCGIARSGAYNRTLTPFGFQSEERTLWEALNVYQSMSPYMYADKVKSPLLLIHGDADNNPGTFPMQSERMFQALKGHGKICRYVNLPHEGHGYRARESVMHVLAEMTAWLDKYCKKNDGVSFV